MDSPQTQTNPSRLGFFLPALLSLALYFSGIFIILTPLPLLYGFLKHGHHGWRDAVVPALGGVVILYATLLGPLHIFYTSHPQWKWLLPMPGMNFMDHVTLQTVMAFGSTYFFFYAVTGFLLAKTLHQKKPSFAPLGWASVFWALIAIVFYLGAASANNFEPYQTLHDMALSSFQKLLAELEKGQSLNLEQLAFVRNNLETLIASYILILPSVVFCGIMLVCALNLFLGTRLFSPLFFRESRMAWINEWRFSFKGVWAVIAGLALFLCSLYFAPSKPAIGLSVNLLIVMAFMYYLQGLTLVSFFLDQRKIGPLGRIVVYGILILLFQTVGILLTLVGFADAWVDFRKQRGKNQVD